MPFSYPKLKEILITGSVVDFNNIDFSIPQDVIIQSSDIRNVYDLDKFENLIRVNLNGSILYDNRNRVVQDLKVSGSTVYTHERKVYLYDRRELN